MNSMTENIKIYFFIILSLLFTRLNAQERDPYPVVEDPSVQQMNREPAHATFMSFGDRETALTHQKSNSVRFKSLNGTWKFKFVTGISNRLKDFGNPDANISDWNNIPVPSNMEIQGY
ncbi:MAG: beta-galactosidase, partial [Christiangramia sp.]|nr:beta-galactosidase [Christiangramia sp.]